VAAGDGRIREFLAEIERHNPGDLPATLRTGWFLRPRRQTSVTERVGKDVLTEGAALRKVSEGRFFVKSNRKYRDCG
jgi:hypothetical protein